MANNKFIPPQRSCPVCNTKLKYYNNKPGVISLVFNIILVTLGILSFFVSPSLSSPAMFVATVILLIVGGCGINSFFTDRFMYWCGRCHFDCDMHEIGRYITK